MFRSRKRLSKSAAKQAKRAARCAAHASRVAQALCAWIAGYGECPVRRTPCLPLEYPIFAVLYCWRPSSSTLWETSPHAARTVAQLVAQWAREPTPFLHYDLRDWTWSQQRDRFPEYYKRAHVGRSNREKHKAQVRPSVLLFGNRAVGKSSLLNSFCGKPIKDAYDTDDHGIFKVLTAPGSSVAASWAEGRTASSSGNTAFPASWSGAVVHAPPRRHPTPTRADCMLHIRDVSIYDSSRYVGPPSSGGPFNKIILTLPASTLDLFPPNEDYFVKWRYHGLTAAILVYDVSNRESLLDVAEWLRRLDWHQKAKRQCKEMFVLVVGNKSDLARAVSADEAKDCLRAALSNDRPWSFLETSAKTGQGVDDAFYTVTHYCIQHMYCMQKLGFDPAIRLPEPAEEPKRSCTIQ